MANVVIKIGIFSNGEIKFMTYSEINSLLIEYKRLYKLGFLHYKNAIYYLDGKLKELDNQEGRKTDKQNGNYQPIINF